LTGNSNLELQYPRVNLSSEMVMLASQDYKGDGAIRVLRGRENPSAVASFFMLFDSRDLAVTVLRWLRGFSVEARLPRGHPLA